MARYVVVGAGGIGGGIGGLLVRAGCDVGLVARGPHLAALASHGLRLRTPELDLTLRLPTWARVADVDWRPDDVVLLAVKCQHTARLVAELRASTDLDLAVATLQNGVESGAQVAAAFSRAACAMVWVPAVHLTPGEVRLHGVPTPGVLVVGSWPTGVAPWVETLVADLERAGLGAQATPDISPVLHGKLLTNLGGALQALCGSSDAVWALAQQAVDEGQAVFQACGVPYVTIEDLLAGPCGEIGVALVGGVERAGGSTHQSLARGSSLETDSLNGSLVRMAEGAGLAAPLNRRICHEVAAAVAEGRGAGETPLSALTGLDTG